MVTAFAILAMFEKQALQGYIKFDTVKSLPKCIPKESVHQNSVKKCRKKSVPKKCRIIKNVKKCPNN